MIGDQHRSPGAPARRVRLLVLSLCLAISCIGALWMWLPATPARAGSHDDPYAPAAPPLNTTAQDFFLPGTLPSGLDDPFAKPNVCAGCHVAEIESRWAGSMMGNSARDPLFRAALQVAAQDAEGGGELCIRCHSPNAWLNGRSSADDGSQINADDLQSVSCSLCHRLVPPFAIPGEATRDAAERAFITTTLNTPSLIVGSAAYVVDRKDFRRGPFDATFASLAHAPAGAAQSSYLRDALICATCHDIDNPLLTHDAVSDTFKLNALNTPPTGDLFPVERTYSEWEHSAFATAEGVEGLSDLYPGLKRKTMAADGPITICQDCHMPLEEGPIVNGGGERTVGKHEWAGGSSVWQKGISEFWSNVPGDTSVNAEAIANGAVLGEQMLQRAAKLDLSIKGVTLTVTITNNTGHKLPTGYAEGRRMWLQVKAFDGNGQAVYASGVPQDGGIQDPVKVYEIKQGISTAQAQVLGRPELEGEGFHFILNNQVLKDNRIPPRGFTNLAFAGRFMQPVAYSYADGQYWDTTVYTLPAEAAAVEVTLFYQTASGDYLDFLEANANTAVADAVVGAPVNWGEVVGSLRDEFNLDAPAVMATATRTLAPAPEIFLPMLQK